ncbi:sialidase family protein [soil metagenome]
MIRVLVMVLLILATSVRSHADSHMPPRHLVFEAGTGGYAVYRIPGIVVTKTGTLLAYCEARQGGSDWGPIRVVGKRSTDGGKTWSEQQQLSHIDASIARNPVAVAKKLGKEGEQTWNSPVMIADPDSGVVHLLYGVENCRAFYRRSEDDGQSWSKPVEITAALDEFRKEYDWKVFAIGPGHGIKLKSGRLVTSMWLSTSTGANAHHPSSAGTIYSDDNGTTWHAGNIAAADSAATPHPNEATMAQLSDGRVMLNLRTQAQENRRLVTISPDGATKWTKPAFDDALNEPICFASLIRLPGQKTLAFSNPNNLEISKGTPKPGQGRDRKNLTIRLSDDDGKTWPHAKVLEAGPSGYSDLAAAKDGTIYCLFEKGKTGSTGNLYLAAFNTDWVKTKE